MNALSSSPLVQWQEFCRQEELAFQRDRHGQAVFYPRVVSPQSGHDDLTWHVSIGRGTVYSVTIMYSKGAVSGNVALIDLDEGFRMLSSVRVDASQLPQIGMRVQVRFEPAQDPEAAPVPVFIPLAGEGA